MRAAYLGRGEGALIRTAYLGAGEASVRAVRWVRGIDVQPTVGVRGSSAAGSQPTGAWSRLGRVAH